MRAHIRVYGNTTTGTVTIVGKDINGNALSETTPTIPIFNSALNSNEQAAFDYVKLVSTARSTPLELPPRASRTAL